MEEAKPQGLFSFQNLQVGACCLGTEQHSTQGGQGDGEGFRFRSGVSSSGRRAEFLHVEQKRANCILVLEGSLGFNQLQSVLEA